EDAQTAAIDALVAEAGGPAWDEAGFRRLRDHVAGELSDRTTAVVGQIAAILDAARDVRRRLEPLTADAVAPARRDVEAQLERLVVPGLATASGAERLPDVERYLHAAARRLERLPDNPARDLDRMRAIQELEAAYRRRLDEWPAGRRPCCARCRGCSRSCGSASSPRASGRAARSRPSGSGVRSRRRRGRWR